MTNRATIGTPSGAGAAGTKAPYDDESAAQAMFEQTAGDGQESGVDASMPGALLAVRNGRVVVEGTPGEAAAGLAWTEGVSVRLLGAPVEATRCRVSYGAELVATVPDVEPYCEYEVEVAPDRMSATLRVVQHEGRRRWFVDAPPARELQLEYAEEAVPVVAPELREAMEALQRAGVCWGIDQEAVDDALAEPGTLVEVAVGLEAEPGVEGRIEQLIDFEARQLSGVFAGARLARRIPKVDGRPGKTVLGRDLKVRPVRDARLVLGPGAAWDEHDTTTVVATVDGQPRYDGASFVEVRHELVIEVVDPSTGDIDFCGSVRVAGDVGEGRRVAARHNVVVEGSVERATVEAGTYLEVRGSIMSSVLRAGQERAVAARVLDIVDDAPRELAEAATRARQLRDASEARGSSISFGLSMQLVLERMYRPTLASLLEAGEAFAEAGPRHLALSEHFQRWHRLLSTAAVGNLQPEAFRELLDAVGREVQLMREATSDSADMRVNYMQASEAEATGTVTLTGKGIYNSRIVAWAGLKAEVETAVIRGGSISSHGPITITELGSPGGARMNVQLGKGASLDCGLVYAGTVVHGPGHSHRFISDRSGVKIRFPDGAMDVQSLAA
jgi:hypothetical protein